MTIAGGIMGALFHRERTGEATTVDVSLLGTGMWAMGQAFALSLVSNMPWQRPAGQRDAAEPPGEQLPDQGRALPVLLLPAGRQVLADAVRDPSGGPSSAHDPRFADHAALLENSRRGAGDPATRRSPSTRWPSGASGWPTSPASGASCRTPSRRPSTRRRVANGYMQECETAGGTPFQLVAAPVQFGGEPAPARRAPEFNEHGDAILEELGIDWDTIVDLKVRSVVG